MTPEGKTKKLLDQLLNEFKAYYLKPVQNGMGSPALDYHGSHLGLAYVIEAKAPGKEPTERQIATLRRIGKSGASLFVIDGQGPDLFDLRVWLQHPIVSYWSTTVHRLLDEDKHETGNG
jgi:hypothetical protein